MKLPELGLIALATTFIYLWLIALVRIFGRRQLAQLSPLDLAVFLCLGSAVETAMVRSSTALKAGFVAAATLFIVNRLIAFACDRNRWFRHLLGGRPVIVVRNGKILYEALRRQGLTEEDLAAALRMREIDDIAEVRFAVMEMDGTINVVGYPANPSPA